MATTRIWKVDTHLPRVLEYAKDESKTANPSWSKDDYQTMRDVMDYAMDDFKTEQQYYVTALNCNADCAREQMQMTKRQFGKTDGILCFPRLSELCRRRGGCGYGAQDRRGTCK